MSRGLPHQYKVLIVDDSRDDRFILREMIGRFPRFSVVGEVEDGNAATTYLAGKEPFADRRRFPAPDLMLLDLNMPKKTGFDVLRWLQTEWYPRLTVIVLCGSDLAEDVGASLALGAHGFWTKAASPNRQMVIVKDIESLMDARWRKWLEPADRKPGRRPSRKATPPSIDRSSHNLTRHKSAQQLG